MNKILPGSMTLLILILLACSPTTFAAVITYGSYTHDTDTNIVTGDGLEWLQWDETIGESIDSIQIKLNTIAGGGWSIASNAQIANLFNAFDFGSSFDADETTGDTVFADDEIREEGGPDLKFIEMFGDTFDASGQYYDYGEGGFQMSAAFFGEDANDNDLYNLAYVNDDYVTSNNDYVPGQASLTGEGYPVTYYTDTVGIALVRPQLRAVPEPSVLTLMGLGLLGFGVTRRKQKKK